VISFISGWYPADILDIQLIFLLSGRYPLISGRYPLISGWYPWYPDIRCTKFRPVNYPLGTLVVIPWPHIDTAFPVLYVARVSWPLSVTDVMIWLVTGTGTVLADCIGTVSLPIGRDSPQVVRTRLTHNGWSSNSGCYGGGSGNGSGRLGDGSRRKKLSWSN